MSTSSSNIVITHSYMTWHLLIKLQQLPFIAKLPEKTGSTIHTCSEMFDVTSSTETVLVMTLPTILCSNEATIIILNYIPQYNLKLRLRFLLVAMTICMQI